MSVPTGADIEALCSKCGDVWHVVVAKVGEEIVRVLCKECGAQHRYRNPKLKGQPAARKSSSSTSSAPRAARAPIVQRFDTPSVAADLSKAVRTYKASERFVVGERVEHPTFGTGVVETAESGKMTVFFAVGRKMLVQAKGDGPAPGNALARPKPFEHKVAGPPPDAKAPAESTDEAE